jgi:16S rRNA (adenine1518-N6/adenine1519-N6)-dimethyltransferase
MSFPYSLTEIKKVLQERQLHLTRKFGQNFLIDANLGKFIVDQGELQAHDIVLEVGTGLGQLTHLMAQKAQKVFSYEIDHGIFQAAQTFLAPYSNIQMIPESILHRNTFPASLYRILEENSPPVIVSNFAYSIATVFLLEWGRQKLPFKRMIAVTQQEMGEKLKAQPGSPEYGIPSIFAQFYYEISALKTLPPQVFWPKPEVYSIVLRLLPRSNPPPVSNFALFHDVVKACFHLRRKTLANSVAHYFQQAVPLTKKVLETAGLDSGQRGETLSLEQCVHLSNEINEKYQDFFRPLPLDQSKGF